ncbi:MAG: hypothetical protein FJX72_07865, partial [Armatimonadetes bacterium]|nr:hypothetical protein [Armatimonadota bacterium]
MHHRTSYQAREPLFALLLAAALVILSPAVLAVEFTTNTTITSSQYSGEAIIVTGCTLTIDCSGGKGWYASLLVRSNGNVTHPAGSDKGLWLGFTGPVEVQSGSSIHADTRGYGSQSGPGGGTSGAGGSHGGTGGYGGAAVYDSITAPTQLGSGGGNTSGGSGGEGGGLIRIETQGAMTINGAVRANGIGYSNRSGGSGGGIWLSADSLSGAGVVQANGGSGSGTTYNYGGGGGGRIALLYSSTTFSGSLTATGGLGRNSHETTNGGCGTVYTKGDSETYGLIVFDNGGLAAWTLHPALDMSTTDIYVRNGLVTFDCSLAPVRANDFTVGPNATVSHPAGN